MGTAVAKRYQTAVVPVEYESAVKALQACVTLDDAKIWADKSDALAAWAKIYRNDEAGIEARRLKLHAFRRMGELAREIRPKITGLVGKGGTAPGSIALMVESGLSLHSANAAAAISKMPKRDFLRAVNAQKPCAPSSLLPKFSTKVSEAWRTIAGACGGNSMLGFRSFCRGRDAETLARSLNSDEIDKARALVTDITEWLDEFEQNLPRKRR